MTYNICVYMFDGERPCANDESPQFCYHTRAYIDGTQLWRGHTLSIRTRNASIWEREESESLSIHSHLANI